MGADTAGTGVVSENRIRGVPVRLPTNLFVVLAFVATTTTICKGNPVGVMTAMTAATMEATTTMTPAAKATTSSIIHSQIILTT